METRALKAGPGVTLEAGQHPPIQSSQDIRQVRVLQRLLAQGRTGQGETPSLGQARGRGSWKGVCLAHPC